MLRALADLPPALIYVVIGAGAAIENVVPPIPADTFVLVGAFLAANGRTDAWLVFLWTWLPNVASALFVYWLARHYGGAFLKSGVGRRLLQPRQLRQIAHFYSRLGTPAIFASRFLPAFRAIVPVFAGISRVGFWRVALPVATASALWYGMLVYVGAAAGRNWRAVIDAFARVNSTLLAAAVILLIVVGIWWWRSRRKDR